MDITLVGTGIVAVVCAVVAYFFMRGKSEREVELLRPRDSRGHILKVVQETDIGLMCKKVKGVTHRFIKAGKGWTFDMGGHMVTRFFGIEGKAYTALVKQSGTENVSVAEYLKWLWGNKFYSQIPEQQRHTVETDIVGITVSIDPFDPKSVGPELPSLSADDVHDQDDNTMLSRFASSTGGEKGGTSWIPFIVSFVLGAMVMFFLMSRGVV